MATDSDALLLGAGRGDANPAPTFTPALSVSWTFSSTFSLGIDSGLFERVRRATGGDGVLVGDDGVSGAAGACREGGETGTIAGK